MGAEFVNKTINIITSVLDTINDISSIHDRMKTCKYCKDLAQNVINYGYCSESELSQVLERIEKEICSITEIINKGK